MNEAKEILIKIVQKYQSGSATIEEFYNEFNDYYHGLHENDESLKQYDWHFYDELNDQLHYTDFETPPDENLISAEKLMKWINNNFLQYFEGKWDDPFKENGL